jgi:hypothetical protein
VDALLRRRGQDLLRRVRRDHRALRRQPACARSRTAPIPRARQHPERHRSRRATARCARGGRRRRRPWWR